MKNSKQTFGQILKRLRLDRNLSIKQLSSTLNINYSYISKLENSHSLPSKEFVYNLSKLFDYDQEELLIRAGKIPEDIIEILKNNPKKAAKFLRKNFSGSNE